MRKAERKKAHRDEVVAAAILREGHARHEEGLARQLEARHARLALPHVVHLAARLQPDRQPVVLPLDAARAVVEAAVARDEKRRLARLARRAQPR